MNIIEQIKDHTLLFARYYPNLFFCAMKLPLYLCVFLHMPASSTGYGEIWIGGGNKPMQASRLSDIEDW